MDINEYQEWTKSTDVLRCEVTGRLPYFAMGLADETGEVLGKIKKIYRDDQGTITDDKRKEITKELGDVMWYLARLSAELGIDLDTVMNENVSKLSDRQERGKLGGSGDNR